MGGSLGQYQGIAAVLKATEDILDNPLISRLVHGDGGIESLDRRFLAFFFQRRPEACQAGDHIMFEGPLFRLFSGIHPVPDRPAMHKNNGMMAILPCRGGRQAIHIFRMNALEDLLKAERRNMVALIDDHHSVTLDQILDFASNVQRLHDRHINHSARASLARSDLTDQALLPFTPSFFLRDGQCFIDRKKLGQFCRPL